VRGIRRHPLVIPGAVLLLGGVLFAAADRHVTWIRGESMEPTISAGDVWWVSSGPPARGDIVSMTSPHGDTVVKRVIGVAGDRIGRDLADGGCALTLNGQRLAEPYLDGPGCRPVSWNCGRGSPNSMPDDTEGCAIPAGRIWVLGDNRPASKDSRNYGPVSAGLVRGTLVRQLANWLP